MELSPRFSKNVPRSSLRFFVPHILAALVIIACLNTHGALGENSESRDSGEQSNESDINQITQRPKKASSTTTTTTLPKSRHTTTPAPPTTTSISKKSSHELHDLYTKFMMNPLEEDDLEYSVDYYNDKHLMKEYNFNSSDIMRRLADSAIAHKTPPNQFLEEIQDMITLQNFTRSESEELEEVSQFTPGLLSENLLKRMTAGWNDELKRLEKKYNVSSECTGPDSITSKRLALMFPHYLNFGQKPYAVPSEISWTSSDYDGNDYNPCKLPAFFKRPEFGGFIPLFNESLNEIDRRAIICTHLYLMYRDEPNNAVPFRTKCVMLKRRMEKSVLSDERRLRFLVNNDIIDRHGQLLKTSIKTAYDKVPSDFKDKIVWDILEHVGSDNAVPTVPF